MLKFNHFRLSDFPRELESIGGGITLPLSEGKRKGGYMPEVNLCKEESKLFDENVERLVEEHESEYVAIVGREIVAYHRDAKKAYDFAKRKYPDKMVYLAQIPSKEALIL